MKFPAFHVIIPGLSEIEDIDNIKALDDYIQFNILKRKIRNNGSLTIPDIGEFANLININQTNCALPVNDFLNAYLSAHYIIRQDIFSKHTGF